MKKPFVIAEIGVNFYDTASVEGITPLMAAKKYIDEAHRVNIDAVKFQSYKADTIVSKNSPAYWDMEKEPTKTQYELFRKFDSFNKEDYAELCDYCHKVGIQFMSTPFDYASADYLYDMCDIYKISSSDLSNLPFIRHIAQKGKPIYLSVGASYISEIEEALRVIQAESCPEVCLMHCVLSYPCKNEDANLNFISTLKRVFPNVKIGYSDHTLPDATMTILTTAYLLGAEVIEKHFTLDKTLPGNDHYHAGSPEDFDKAIHNFRLVDVVRGSADKTVLPCEEIPRKEARRSLVAAKAIPCGKEIVVSDLIAKRPGTGISPKHQDIVVGRHAQIDIKADTVLTWDMI